MTTPTPNVFPILTASTTDAEMLRLLRNPEIAIGFALEHLQPWELGMFFKDWKDDADMTGWLCEWREKQDAAAREVPDYSDMRAFNRNLAAQRRERKAQQNADPKN